jgi:hypothetical protein
MSQLKLTEQHTTLYACSVLLSTDYWWYVHDAKCRPAYDKLDRL